MNTKKTVQNELIDIQINIKIKLALLWTSFMFLYIYVDYLHFYMPKTITDIQSGRVFKFDITQTFLLIALSSLTIPALMIFLSIVLPAKINRYTNIIIAIVYIPYTLFNLAGEAWIHMIFAAIVEVILLCLIIIYAWKWPRVETA